MNSCKYCGDYIEKGRNGKRKICDKKECKSISNNISILKCSGKSRIRKCIECGIEFDAAFRMRNTCSDDCLEVKKKNKQKQKDKIKNKIKGNKKDHRQRAAFYQVEYDSKISINFLRKKYKGKCSICGTCTLEENKSGYDERNATIGHIKALSRGGNHTKDNVQLECQKCNLKKGTTTLKGTQ